jgi:hypothetical protein
VLHTKQLLTRALSPRRARTRQAKSTAWARARASALRHHFYWKEPSAISAASLARQPGQHHMPCCRLYSTLGPHPTSCQPLHTLQRYTDPPLPCLACGLSRPAQVTSEAIARTNCSTPSILFLRDVKDVFEQDLEHMPCLMSAVYAIEDCYFPLHVNCNLLQLLVTCTTLMPEQTHHKLLTHHHLQDELPGRVINSSCQLSLSSNTLLLQRLHATPLSVSDITVQPPVCR